MQASKLNPHGDPRDEPVSHSRRGFVRRLSGAGILTLTAPEPLRAAGGRHGGEPIPGRRMPLIYVVDDEPDLLTMERLVLEEAGFGVETFGDRAEAWRAVDRRRATPDLLITDYVGSPFSAATLIQNCREVVSGLRVLLVTGHPDIVSGSAWPGLAGPDRVLAKPFDLHEFLGVVRILVGDELKRSASTHTQPGAGPRGPSCPLGRIGEGDVPR